MAEVVSTLQILLVKKKKSIYVYRSYNYVYLMNASTITKQTTRHFQLPCIPSVEIFLWNGMATADWEIVNGNTFSEREHKNA